MVESALIKSINLYTKNSVHLAIQEYLEDIIDAYENIKNSLQILKLPLKNFEHIIILRSNYLYLIDSLTKLIDHLRYFLRVKKIDSTTVNMPFTIQSSIIYVLHDTIVTMLYLKDSIPVPECRTKNIEQAHVFIDQFTFHGHFLLNLSKNKDEHRIIDIIFYLRYVNKNIKFIQENVIMEIASNLYYRF